MQIANTYNGYAKTSRIVIFRRRLTYTFSTKFTFQYIANFHFNCSTYFVLKCLFNSNYSITVYQKDRNYLVFRTLYNICFKNATHSISINYF